MSSEAKFLQRDRDLGCLAHACAPLRVKRILSSEDPAEVVKLASMAGIALFRTTKDMPGSITQIAERLHKDRSAVRRDIDEFERAGLITIAEKPLPSRGGMKDRRVTACQISLQALIN